MSENVSESGASFTDASTSAYSNQSTVNLDSTNASSQFELPEDVQQTLKAVENEKTEKTEKLKNEQTEKSEAIEIKKKKKRKLEGEEEEVDEIVQNAFTTIIGTEKYSPLRTTDWMSQIIGNVSKALMAKEGKNRKFVVHCTISARIKTFSICSANMCSWDLERDAAYYSEWTSQTVFGAVQVFLVSHRFT